MRTGESRAKINCVNAPSTSPSASASRPGGGLTRRAALRGLGVTLALPWLESLPAWGDTSTATPGSATKDSGPANPFPQRFAALYMPNGVNQNHWTPSGHGRDFKLSSILEPLERHQSELLVLTQLSNRATFTGDGHYVKTGGWLTSTTITRTTGADLCAGNTSVDQRIAQVVGNFTPLPSLELGIEPPSTGVDTNVGFTQLYGAHISWATPTTPLTKEVHPRLAFERLFRSRTGTAGHPHNPAQQRSVLDLVAEDTRRLQARVSSADRLKLQEYLDSVRAIEKRIEFETHHQREQYLADPVAVKALEQLGGRVSEWARRFDPFKDPGQASERGVRHQEHVKLMLDILALAFYTDTTRVGSFMFGNSVSGRDFSFVDGVKGGFHENSHHENLPEKLEMYRRINRWHSEQLAYFLDRLRSYPEGDGTVLDHSLILHGAGIRDGNQHNPHNLPLILAGRGGGSVAPGRHLVYDADTPMANLHLGLLRRFGVRADRFADSTEELPGLSDSAYTGKTA